MTSHFSGPLSWLHFWRRDLVCGFILLPSPPERQLTRPLFFLGLDSPPCWLILLASQRN